METMESAIGGGLPGFAFKVEEYEQRMLELDAKVRQCTHMRIHTLQHTHTPMWVRTAVCARPRLGAPGSHAKAHAPCTHCAALS